MEKIFDIKFLDGLLQQAKECLSMSEPKRILIADDEPEIRAIVELLLRGEGYDVVPVCDGQEAADRAGDDIRDGINDAGDGIRNGWERAHDSIERGLNRGGSTYNNRNVIK
jgi:hypothetical protein